jgi:hypothetical protein
LPILRAFAIRLGGDAAFFGIPRRKTNFDNEKSTPYPDGTNFAEGRRYPESSIGDLIPCNVATS